MSRLQKEQSKDGKQESRYGIPDDNGGTGPQVKAAAILNAFLMPNGMEIK